MIRWIELAGADKSFQGLKDISLREQFIKAAHRKLALFLKERKPDNINLMAELADQFLEAHGSQTMFSKTKLIIHVRSLGIWINRPKNKTLKVMQVNP